jgi:hypothetical protein
MLIWTRFDPTGKQTAAFVVILSEAKNLRLFGFARSRQQSEMFESLASCFAFLCSASLNMTMVNEATTART